MSDKRWRVARRCGVTHNENDYNSAVADTLAGLGKWKLTSSQGWRLCGASLDKCREACTRLGDCAEISMTPNGECCFLAKSTCYGDQRKKDTKYLVDYNACGS